MSTEHQRYSTENQKHRISLYARMHGIDIVRTYADLGKSGLTLEGREGLASLLSDVVSGRADFNVILVYDVSRWGRFQDTDEAAHYEFVCRRSGIQVHYCAEQFRNDGSMPSTLMKTMKRTMAGEYSRELSVKVFAGAARLAQLGFRQGGKAGYAFRRLLVDENRQPKQVLQPGQYKNIHCDRIILVPGTRYEIGIVQEIYDRYTKQRQTPGQIAKALNDRSVPTHMDKPWVWSDVREILRNPKYAGMNAYHRTTQKLKTRVRQNPPEQWIVRTDAFTPMVSRKQFDRAQQIMASRRPKRFSREELLEAARRIITREGRLSFKLIEDAKDAPCVTSYIKKFGGIAALYKSLGFALPSSLEYVKQNRAVREIKRKQLQWMAEQLRSVGATVEYRKGSQLLINRSFKVALRITTFQRTKAGNVHWEIGLQSSAVPDITILARLRPDNAEIMDYFIVPSTQGLSMPTTLRLHVRNHPVWDTYRFPNLDFLFRLAARMSPWKVLCQNRHEEWTRYLAPKPIEVQSARPRPQTN